MLAIRAGDKQAFRTLFDRHYRVLLGTAINILRDPEAGRDMAQEVFYQLWKNREKLDIHSTVAAYLKRAVINRSLNHIKARKPLVDAEQMPEEPDRQASPVDALAHQELQEALEAALQTLPERCRTIFVMKRLEGMRQKEIAEILQISPKTVENQITKALRILGKALKQYRNKGGAP